MTHAVCRPENNFLVFDCAGFEQAVAAERQATLKQFGLKRLLQWTLHCTQEAQRQQVLEERPAHLWPMPSEVEALSLSSLLNEGQDFTVDDVALKEESIHRTVRDLYLYFSQLLHQCGYLPAQVLCTRVFTVREPLHVVLKTTGDHRYATWH